MLCSNCYKKIPEGEEVKRGSSDIYWRAGWWWGRAGGKSGVFCLGCAKNEAKREKRVWKAFIFLFFFFSLIIISVLIFSVIKKGL